MSFIIKNIAAITASIFGSGIGCAGPIAGWARSRRRRSALTAPLLGLTLIGASAAPPAAADLQVSIAGLRSEKGAVMLCLTMRTEQRFLTCGDDPARLMRVVAASEAQRIELTDIVPGDYSLLVIHDENRNGRLDKTVGIPREGFGFSRNPAIRFGPPLYQDVHFPVPPGHSAQAVKVKYLL